MPIHLRHLALAGALLAPQLHAQASPEARRAELVGQIEAAAAKAAQGDFVTVLSSLFAPEGVHLSVRPAIMRGPDGARKWLERDTLAGRSRARLTVVRSDVSADGRDGYAYGYIDVIHPAGDTLPGRYHSYWRRNPAGRWEILAFTRGRRAAGPDGPAIPAELAVANAARWPQPNADTVAVLKEIFAAEGAFCDSAAVSVSAAFGGFAAPDAGKIEGGSFYRFGRTAITEMFSNPPPGVLGPVWRPEFGSAAASGDLGFTFGPAWPRVAGPVQNEPPATGGRYFTIWKRQKDGTWRYLVD